MVDYNPQAIEKKWQTVWESRGTNSFTSDQLRNAKDPYYNLMMFPYPSAEGLHIGNIYAYTGADVEGRYQRLLGKDVFEPMGFDAFGMHSENFALKHGTHPNALIPANIANFTQQLKRIGGMFDWDHCVDTTDPSYYKWTQWLFVKLYKAGLVERREAPVNWCPSCKTVVANEQVIQGLCERCDSVVEQRRLPQWFILITKYAQQLLDNLKTIDWSEHTKKAQSHWIGRSEGAELEFPVEHSTDRIRVFTTRPDTVCGASYMVLAPEHELVARFTTDEQRIEVEAYLETAAKLDLVQRKVVEREKTGVWTGSFCLNPVSGARIPVWISDYVLIEYGTGAIMAVPAHDERDFEFASSFDLPIPRVIAGPTESADTPVHEAFIGDGTLVNSGEFDGLSVAEGKRRIVDCLADQGLAEATVNYRLHDWCISRQRYWGPPIPIIHCPVCGPVVVPEEDLPVVLPYLSNFQPDDSGQSPLTRAAEWCAVDCPECGTAATRETDVSDTFLDSSWYFLRYPCSDNEHQAWDQEMSSKWLPVTSYVGGHEHAVLHLLYARFITMALHDMGLLDFEEPFQKFRAHGLLIKDGRKISKSRGNIIIPDDVIEQYGADTVRLYLMFLGPFEQGGDYQAKGIPGPFNFIRRLWQTVHDAVDQHIDPEIEKLLHRTIKKVTTDLEELRFNTAIAALMEYLNEVRRNGRQVSRREVEPLVLLVAPFAPHVAEELYRLLGHAESLFESARWPEYNPKLLSDNVVEIGVQINGKLRGSIELEVAASEEDALGVAQAHANVAAHLAQKSIRKIIYIPGRMLNLVVGQ